MSQPRSSSEIDRAWDDADIEWPPAPPVVAVPLARAPALAKGSHLMLEAIVEAIVEAPVPQPIRARPQHRHWRRIVMALACGVAAAICVVLAWPRQSTEHAHVPSPSPPPSPSTPIAAVAPAPAPAPTKATQLTAKPVRPSVTATKHPQRPSKVPARAAAATKSFKKAPAKRSGPRLAK